MSLRIRRGTEAQRTGATFDSGEVAWTTDTNKLYVGDGVNLGGKNILATSAGTGLVWNATTQRLDFNGLGSGIINVQADTNPSLGGNLNLNNRNITGTGNINVTGTITATQFSGTQIGASTITATNIITTEIIPNVDASVIINGRSENPFVIKGIVTAIDPNGINLELRAAAGTILSPANISPGNQVASIKTSGYYNSVYKQASQLTTLWSPDANLQKVYPKSALYFSIGNNTDDQELKAILDGNGTFKSNIIQLTSYPSTGYPAGGNNIELTSVQTTGTSGQFQCATASATLVVGGTVKISGTNTGNGGIAGYANPTTYYIIATNGTTTFTLSTTTNGSGVVTTAGTLAGLTYSVLLPEEGMMIFDNTTKKFMGYNGTNWVAFTGP